MRLFALALILAVGIVSVPAAAEDQTLPPAVAVTEVSGDALQAAVAKHKDKVVVVDLWATWCESCVKKFPHFVSMHKKYGDKGLVCVSVCMNKLTPKSYKNDEVLAFLKKQGAEFPNFVVNDPEKDETPLTKLLTDDYRLIPLMVIFDKAGRRVWTSADGPDLKDDQLDKKVEELLAK